MKSHNRIITVVAVALTMVFASDAFAGKGPRRDRGERGERGVRGERFGQGGPGAMAARLAGHMAMLDLLLSETAPIGFTIEDFPDADTDGDGVLSDTEWQSFAADRKAKMTAMILRRDPSVDADASGEIDDAELAAFVEARRTDMKARLLENHPDVDTDGDGVLSDAEVEAFESPRLQRLLERVPEADLNGDGVLDRGEWATHMLIGGPKDGRGGPKGIGSRDRLRHQDGSCDVKGSPSKSAE